MKLFLAGIESRHWIPNLMISGGGITYKTFSGITSHLPEVPGGVQLAIQAFGGSFSDAAISCREYDLSNIHRSDTIWGGFDQITHEDIHGGRDTVLREEKYRGGFDVAIKTWKPYILESFFYADADTERLLPYYGDFLLDSGAFTFCGTGGFTKEQFEPYLEKYADFINRNKIDKFFELDVDSITGYEKVLEYRKKLERLTGKQPIPVWHISRGKEEFIRHCDEFPYIALGGYVAAIKASDPRQKAYVRAYPWFINEAHKRGKKLHGLGFTSLDGLTKYHFDSVDSTAWTTGNRFGYLYYFDGKTIRKKDAPKGHRLSDSRRAALNNYTEWIKFQKYADTHL